MRFQKASVQTGEGAQLLMARARLVDADTTACARLMQRVARRTRPLAEREELLYD